MLIVTGGTGFVGSNLVRHLNHLGATNILIVDDVSPSSRIENLSACRFSDYVHKDKFLNAIAHDHYRSMSVEAILHQGACADTMESDEEKVLQTNFSYSRWLLDWALNKHIPFIYASSAAIYGTNAHFTEDPRNEMPLNLYARSKWMFDCHVRNILQTAKSTLVGLRYFNVYGRNEAHKGPMASMVHQLHYQLRVAGKARLFGASHRYAPGEQRRDFVFVEDVVKANMFFLGGPIKRGIYNIGTGISRSFNDLANILISFFGTGSIEYVPFPSNLATKYQDFTQADLSRLRNAGFDHEFTSLEEGIRRTFFARDHTQSFHQHR